MLSETIRLLAHRCALVAVQSYRNARFFSESSHPGTKTQHIESRDDHTSVLRQLMQGAPWYRSCSFVLQGIAIGASREPSICSRANCK